MNPAGQEVRKEPQEPWYPLGPSQSHGSSSGSAPRPRWTEGPYRPSSPQAWLLAHLHFRGRPGSLFGGNMTSNERAFFLLAGFEPFQNFKNIYFLTLKGSLQTVEKMKKSKQRPHSSISQGYLLLTFQGMFFWFSIYNYYST